MAFRFADPGGRSYGVAGNIPVWWNNVSATPSAFSLTASGGRNTGTSIRLSAITGNRYVSRVFDAQNTWGIAFAIKVTSETNVGSTLFCLTDSGAFQCELRHNNTNTLTVTRNGTTLGNTTATVPIGAWAHVEWKTVIHPTAGTTEIRINGIPALVLTSQNTQATGNATANTILFGSTANVTYVIDFDDIIIWDGQLTDAQGNPDIHDFIGDCGLAWLLPNGDGTTTQFARDSGTNNYLRVNEATPDGDTSYTFDSTINDIDTYAMANLPAGATGVKSLMAVSYLRKDDVGSRVAAPVIRTNSANFVGTSVPLGNSYIYAFNTWGSNPSGTPANWSVADVNAIEGGQKVIS